ncbi:hypothetical protein [Chitinophaga pinensis]|uniref:Uncharacterized protein n=1 Tax=Chitinophaga pinensis (strain ATCC 43595 / DSM 2588 / LMG 13176 / NBRC 15968 / NCIMB 11800 / UQM 2034) TaxID=485918 RepID=A0A979G5W4_CHIPD|nr:hypothetical protein [Chitinophaga pinensis]ACU61301.1 hypothetical protein Cpin_3839 [Chitinophaga pinensis DSM 2588]
MKQYKNDKPKKGEELIPVVIFEFHDMPDFWLHKGQYELEGKFRGILKYLGISIRDVKKVHHLLKHASAFPDKEWEG